MANPQRASTQFLQRFCRSLQPKLTAVANMRQMLPALITKHGQLTNRARQIHPPVLHLELMAHQA